MATATLGNTIGVAFFSVVGASILCGSTFAQTYMYYHNYRQDPILNKWAAGILCSLDTLHLVFLVYAVYNYNVIHYGYLPALLNISWSLKLQALIGIVIVLLVHCLYAQRVWMLSGYHNGVLGYLVILVVVGGAVVGVVVSYVIFSSHTFATLQKSAWAIYAALSVSTSIDFVLAAAMCYYLRKSRGNIDTRLNSKISKVIQYTISSGLLTSSFSLAALFSYGLMPHTYIGISLTGFSTKLYTASFLAMLNSREQTTNQRISGIFNTIMHTPEHRPPNTGTKSESGVTIKEKSRMSERLTGIFKKISKERLPSDRAQPTIIPIVQNQP